MEIGMTTHRWLGVIIRRRTPRRGRVFRHLTLESMEYRWLLSAAVQNAPQATAWSTDCSDEGGWADVGSSGSGGTGGEYSGGSWGTSSNTSAADTLQAKRPVLAVLSPAQFATNASRDGGLVDLTSLVNQSLAARNVALYADGTAGTEGNDGNAAASANAGTEHAARAAISPVSFDALQGTAQALDVAMTPARPKADAMSGEDVESTMRTAPAPNWPLPLLLPMHSGYGSLPATSALPPAKAATDGQETSSLPTQPAPANAGLPFAALAHGQQTARDAGALHSKGPGGEIAAVEPHEQVFEQIAVSVKDLLVAAGLNDRRLQSAIVVVAVASASYQRWRRTNGPAV